MGWRAFLLATGVAAAAWAAFMGYLLAQFPRLPDWLEADVSWLAVGFVAFLAPFAVRPSGPAALAVPLGFVLGFLAWIGVLAAGWPVVGPDYEGPGPGLGVLFAGLYTLPTSFAGGLLAWPLGLAWAGRR